MDKIDGYEIQKTILFETGYGFALGCVPESPEKSAVWNFTETACGRDYLLFGKLSASTFFTLNAAIFKAVYRNVQNR